MPGPGANFSERIVETNAPVSGVVGCLPQGALQNPLTQNNAEHYGMARELVPPSMLEQVARRFKLLSEPARLDLLNHLQIRGEMQVQELVDATGYQQSNVSKHLLLMAQEGVLRRRKAGLNVYYSIDDPTISGLCMLVCGRLQQEMV